MDLLLLLLTALLLATWVVMLGRTVRRDGLGTRQPPRSHPAWWDEPSSG